MRRRGASVVGRKVAGLQDERGRGKVFEVAQTGSRSGWARRISRIGGVRRMSQCIWALMWVMAALGCVGGWSRRGPGSLRRNTGTSSASRTMLRASCPSALLPGRPSRHGVEPTRSPVGSGAAKYGGTDSRTRSTAPCEFRGAAHAAGIAAQDREVNREVALTLCQVIEVPPVPPRKARVDRSHG
jgi:hypothetical protein